MKPKLERIRWNDAGQRLHVAEWHGLLLSAWMNWRGSWVWKVVVGAYALQEKDGYACLSSAKRACRQWLTHLADACAEISDGCDACAETRSGGRAGAGGASTG